MDTDQLERVMQSDSKVAPGFLGVYARDEIKEMIVPDRRPISMIVNTDPGSKPGMHWVCMYLDSANEGPYFDSYGRMPSHDDFYSFMSRNGARWVVNNRSLQHRSSDSCGRYCAYYL